MGTVPILQQYQYEVEGWERLLSFITQENNNYKTRLSEIVSSNLVDGDLLRIESFLEDFIAQDKVIAYLSAELKKQNALLGQAEKQCYLFNDLISNHLKLRREIAKEEEMFAHLKEEFSTYLSAHLTDHNPLLM